MSVYNLPEDYRPYIDKYFLRAKEILRKENLNPTVTAQVFLRREGKIYGINETMAIFEKYSNLGNLCLLKEEECRFKPLESVLKIMAPIQDIIDLETMYLGVISRETTLNNGGQDIDLRLIRNRMAEIVELVGDRSVSYFGARHWGYERDQDIARVCKEAGAANCSTDEGAKAWGIDCKGIGTIPHALEAIYHWKYGLNNAVVESTKVFNKHIDKKVPRIALVDYANREILDSLRVTDALGKDLYGIRIDTCGENYMQGVVKDYDYKPCDRVKGVCVDGVVQVRRMLDLCGFKDVKIILSSGFAKPEKVKAFVKAEKRLGIKLFDELGVGALFDSWTATMDIVRVENMPISKVGRQERLPYVFT